jgi:endonuclease/exonuclease/phosphatase family metal-dependent hydrolase
VKLRLASYNVHGCVGTDGAMDAARVARAIGDLSADAVGLQEVPFERTAEGGFSPLALLDGLPGYRAVCAPIERRDGVWHGNVLLTSASVERARSICLSVNRREPRTALEVEISASGRRCRVITTHLGLRPVERRYQVRALLRHLACDPQLLTILLGDFNEWFLHGRPLRWLEKYFGRGRALATYPSRWPLFALDRVWVHPSAQLLDYRVADGAMFRVASDHLPIVVEVALA